MLGLPESVLTIGNSAFEANQLTNLTIPNSVTSIVNSDFAGTAKETLFIPEGSLQDYLDKNWSFFDEIIETTFYSTIAAKVFLQGSTVGELAAGEEDLIRDSLRANNLLPPTPPYGDGTTVDPTVFDTTGTDAL